MIKVVSKPLQILSAQDHIVFDVLPLNCAEKSETALENPYSATFEDALEFAKKLSSEKARWAFQNIVAIRTFTSPQTNNHKTYSHGLGVWRQKGPFTMEQFKTMVQFNHSISNEQWLKYLDIIANVKTNGHSFKATTASGSELLNISSEHNHIVFDVLDFQYSVKIENALQLAQTAQKLSSEWIFQKIVVVRSITSPQTNNSNIYSHDLGVWNQKGSFTMEQFMKMVQFDHSLSNDQWLEYLDNVASAKTAV